MVYILGYYLFLIIFSVIGIVRAGKGNPWIWYGIGVVLTLLSLAGNTISARMMGGDVTPMWVLFAVLAVVFAAIISVRDKK